MLETEPQPQPEPEPSPESALEVARRVVAADRTREINRRLDSPLGPEHKDDSVPEGMPTPFAPQTGPQTGLSGAKTDRQSGPTETFTSSGSPSSLPPRSGKRTTLALNILLVGQQGMGKTTAVESLFKPYTDEATATAAAQKIAEIRGKAATDLPVKMISDVKGAAFVSA